MKTSTMEALQRISSLIETSSWIVFATLAVFLFTTFNVNAQVRLPGTDAERAEGTGYAISLLGEDVVDLKQRVALLEDILSEEIEGQLEQSGWPSSTLEDEVPDEVIGIGNVDSEDQLFTLCFQNEEGYEYCAISSEERGFIQLMVLWSEDAIDQRAFVLIDVPELYQGKGKVTQIFMRPIDRPWLNVVVNDDYDVVLEMDNHQWHCVGLEPRYQPMVD